jgi:hypothetical protein
MSEQLTRRLTLALEHCVDWLPADCSATLEAQAILSELSDIYEVEQTGGQETDRDWSQAQDWAGMDGATAFLLINRHADGWGDTRAMMEAWLKANAALRPYQGGESNG